MIVANKDAGVLIVAFESTGALPIMTKGFLRMQAR